MADKKYVISETGEFPPQYKVLRLDDDGIYRPVFGPDPDLSDSERKCAEMNVDRVGNTEKEQWEEETRIALEETRTISQWKNENAVSRKKVRARKKVRSKKKLQSKKKLRSKKKVRTRKKVRSKKAVAKKKTAKKTAKKR